MGTEPNGEGLALPPIHTNALHPRLLAHLGDAVYELFVRELALRHLGVSGSQQLDDLHRFTTQRVNATYQQGLLTRLKPCLTEFEQDLVRRGRNQPVTTKRRHEHNAHRQASGFEALIGYLHLNDPQRLQVLWAHLTPALLETTPKPPQITP